MSFRPAATQIAAAHAPRRSTGPLTVVIPSNVHFGCRSRYASARASSMLLPMSVSNNTETCSTMPYVREGAQKVSDHWVRSPLLEGNINRACQVCHNVPEPELRARAETIQNRTHKLIGNASRALVDMEAMSESRD